MQMIEGKRDWTHALPRDAVVRLIRADAESGVKEGLPGIEIENMLQVRSRPVCSFPTTTLTFDPGRTARVQRSRRFFHRHPRFDARAIYHGVGEELGFCAGQAQPEEASWRVC